MVVVRADVSLCQGYANCVENSPATFDLDDAGTVKLLKGRVDEDERAEVEEAVRSCPVSALSFAEQSMPEQ